MAKRLAIIGCGCIAQAHAEAASRLAPDECQAVAVVDRDLDQATAFARQFAPEAQVGVDVGRVLQETNLDAVVICTPPSAHAALVERALLHKVAVLCEKPFVINTQDGRELVEIAARQGVLLRTSVKYRFTAGVRAVKQSLLEGKIGAVRQVQITFAAPLQANASWRFEREQSGGGVLMDNGPHAVDLARFLLGEVTLRNAELAMVDKNTVEHEARLWLESERSIPVDIQLSWASYLDGAPVQIQGETGSLEMRWNGAVLIDSSGTERVIAPGYSRSQAFEWQLRSFLAALAGEPSEADWHSGDGLCAVEIIAAVYETGSWRTG